MCTQSVPMSSGSTACLQCGSHFKNTVDGWVLVLPMVFIMNTIPWPPMPRDTKTAKQWRYFGSGVTGDAVIWLT